MELEISFNDFKSYFERNDGYNESDHKKIK